MKRTIVVLCTLFLSAALGGVATAKPRVGTAAPLFTAMGTDGMTRSLEEFRGAYVVLEWTNHQCPFVGKHYGTGNMQALQRELTDKGVVWLSIISSAPGKQGYVSSEKANALTRDRNAAPSAVLLDSDGKVGRLYAARTTPHMFIVDPQGTLIYMGGIDDKPSARWSDVDTASNYVRTAMNEALTGAPATASVTRPYGCSVKY